MAFRHEVLHIRRQKQRLIDIPGPKILAHSQRLNQTRLELNSDYSDRLLEQEIGVPKNIVVFSDGTGQDGGARPEQRISNIYKMYRISRDHADTGIDPSRQVVFYDAGLGKI